MPDSVVHRLSRGNLQNFTPLPYSFTGHLCEQLVWGRLPENVEMDLYQNVSNKEVDGHKRKTEHLFTLQKMNVIRYLNLSTYIPDNQKANSTAYYNFMFSDKLTIQGNDRLRREERSM